MPSYAPCDYRHRRYFKMLLILILNSKMHYHRRFIFVSNVLWGPIHSYSLMNPSHNGSARFCLLRNCNNCPRGKKSKRKQSVIQIRKKNVSVHIIIMFQSFIRHARVMNNFFRHLHGSSVPTVALSPFARWLRCADFAVVNYSTETNAPLFYLHNFHRTGTHNIIIHYTLYKQIC